MTTLYHLVPLLHILDLEKGRSCDVEEPLAEFLLAHGYAIEVNPDKKGGSDKKSGSDKEGSSDKDNNDLGKEGDSDKEAPLGSDNSSEEKGKPERKSVATPRSKKVDDEIASTEGSK